MIGKPRYRVFRLENGEKQYLKKVDLRYVGNSEFTTDYVQAEQWGQSSARQLKAMGGAKWHTEKVKEE